jgi:hypothetical protein
VASELYSKFSYTKAELVLNWYKHQILTIFLHLSRRALSGSIKITTHHDVNPGTTVRLGPNQYVIFLIIILSLRIICMADDIDPSDVQNYAVSDRMSGKRVDYG